MICPAPTVLPPSRIANLNPSLIATPAINSTVIVKLSQGKYLRQCSDKLFTLLQETTKIHEIKSSEPEIKNTGIEKEVLNLINKNQITNYCIISSFNPFVLSRIKKMNKNIQTALLWTLDKPQFILNSTLWVWWSRPD